MSDRETSRTLTVVAIVGTLAFVIAAGSIILGVMAYQGHQAKQAVLLAEQQAALAEQNRLANLAVSASRLRNDLIRSGPPGEPEPLSPAGLQSLANEFRKLVETADTDGDTAEALGMYDPWTTPTGTHARIATRLFSADLDDDAEWHLDRAMHGFARGTFKPEQQTIGIQHDERFEQADQIWGALVAAGRVEDGLEFMVVFAREAAAAYKGDPRFFYLSGRIKALEAAGRQEKADELYIAYINDLLEQSRRQQTTGIADHDARNAPYQFGGVLSYTANRHIDRFPAQEAQVWEELFRRGETLSDGQDGLAPLNNAGALWERAGDHDRALALLERGVAEAREDPEDHAVILERMLIHLGSVYTRLGRHGEARAALDEADRMNAESANERNRRDIDARRDQLAQAESEAANPVPVPAGDAP
ncbi:MAG: hypothetical protein DHS20C14_22410 [Phycisphaeraceae bacterium]|nr:MAG: hypothetical protein DHS20C14_22410 [Phycisphaeraceae bacterium]